jgi:murein endopeptidase
MIQSSKDLSYYKMPEAYGITKVRHGMVWGKRHMIEFLIKLARLWTQDPYWQIDLRGKMADIPLGDISVEGGSPPRWKVPKVNGHSSHRCGIDVDIYVLSQDGTPSQTVTHKSPNYDFERTEELAKLIVTAGGTDLDEVFIGDDRLVSTMKDQAAKRGVSFKSTKDSPMHDNHFHIRLVNKDGSLC